MRALRLHTLMALRDRGLYKAPLGDGKHDITCPWLKDHTGEVNGGTAYFEPDDNWPIGGFMRAALTSTFTYRSRSRTCRSAQ